MRRKDKSGREWQIKKELYADETVLMAASREALQHIVNEFRSGCDRMRGK